MQKMVIILQIYKKINNAIIIKKNCFLNNLLKAVI